MNTPPKIESNDNISARETTLFGAPVETLSYGCQNVYQVLRIEDLEYIETQLNFNWGSLNSIENADQFEQIRPLLEELLKFRQERESVGVNDIAGRRAVIEKYKPIAKNLSVLIDRVSE